jgi:hypothetical protein
VSGPLWEVSANVNAGWYALVAALKRPACAVAIGLSAGIVVDPNTAISPDVSEAPTAWQRPKDGVAGLRCRDPRRNCMDRLIENVQIRWAER